MSIYVKGGEGNQSPRFATCFLRNLDNAHNASFSLLFPPFRLLWIPHPYKFGRAL